MHRLARFLDPRHTIEGKIVTAILLIVLVFSMVNLSTIVEFASAAGSNDSGSNNTELNTDTTIAEYSADEVMGENEYVEPTVLTGFDQQNSVDGVNQSSEENNEIDGAPSEENLTDVSESEESKEESSDNGASDENAVMALSENAPGETYFDQVKNQIQDPNGPAEITLTESFTATSAIEVSRKVTIAGKDDISINRDAQNHSIFVVKENGDLTLSNVKLVGQNEDSTSANTKSYYSPVIVENAGSLMLENMSLINGFAANNGGAITAYSNSNVIIDNSVISNNKACNSSKMAYGGGIQADGANIVLRNNAMVKNNVADSYSSDPNWRAYGGIGGGINLVNSASLTINSSSIIGNEAGNKLSEKGVCKAGAGGGIAVNRHCGLVMNEGVITGNSAHCSSGNSDYISATYGGGGIYIGSAFDDNGEIYSDKVKLNSGTISNNFSNSVGGGIYIHTNSELDLVKTLITKNGTNTAYGSMGGGVYVCGAGNNAFFATNGCLVTGNTAPRHGDDCELEDSFYYSHSFSHLSTRIQDGTKIEWFTDALNNRFNKGTSTPIDGLQEYLDANRSEKSIALHSEVSEVAGVYDLKIVDNSADIGAGIGCNGYLFLGEQKDISLSLKKEWKNSDGTDLSEEEIPDFIQVDVYNKNKKIDSVTLNKENQWQVTLTDLPYNGEYMVKEVVDDSEEATNYTISYQYGSVVEGEESPGSLVPGEATEKAEREYDVTITNTKAPSFGELVINKSFTGTPFDMGNGLGTSTAVFHVEGFEPLSDVQDGDFEDASQFAKIYDNYVSINYGDENLSKTLSNLPAGITYRVTEVTYEDSGFINKGQVVQTQILSGGNAPKIEFNFDNSIDGEHPNQGVINQYSFSTDGNKVNGNLIEQES